MTKKRLIMLLVVAFVIIIIVVLAVPNKIEKSNSDVNSVVTPVLEENKPEPDEQRIGGDRDEYGCIGSAGYSWCEKKQKCLRDWEESCK